MHVHPGRRRPHDLGVTEIQDAWLRVFRVPWLPKGNKAPAYKHLDELYDDYKQAKEKP